MSLKKSLALSVTIGLVAGLVIGYAITAQQIRDLRSQLSGLQSRIEELEENMPPLRTLADAQSMKVRGHTLVWHQQLEGRYT